MSVFNQFVGDERVNTAPDRKVFSFITRDKVEAFDVNFRIHA